MANPAGRILDKTTFSGRTAKAAAAPSTRFVPVGSAAALAVRPEKLRLSPVRPERFALAATVVSVGYQGGQSTVHLVTEAGRPLRAYLPSAAALGFTRGAAVWASWSPASTRSL